MIYGDTFLSTVSPLTCGLWSSDSHMVVVAVVAAIVVVVMSNAGGSNSEVMQPDIKHLVVCKKVMECDYTCTIDHP
jgi:hypothetical protein